MEEKKKIVLFDLDGTLVDSFDSVLHTIEESMRLLDVPIPKEIYEEQEVGKLLQIAEKNLPLSVSKIIFKDIYDSILINSPLNGVKINRNAAYLTEQLKLLGFTLIVLTNKRESVASAICNTLFPANTFEKIIGRKTPYPIKPYTSVLNELNAVNVKTSQIQCLIGDSKEDYLTAELLGIDFYDINGKKVIWGLKEDRKTEGKALIQFLNNVFSSR